MAKYALTTESEVKKLTVNDVLDRILDIAIAEFGHPAWHHAVEMTEGAEAQGLLESHVYRGKKNGGLDASVLY